MEETDRRVVLPYQIISFCFLYYDTFIFYKLPLILASDLTDHVIRIDIFQRQRNICFIIHVERYPVLQEKIRVGTWAYDFKGSMGYRNIVIRDENGANIVQAASQWSYIDTDTLRPVRIEPEVGEAYPLAEKLPMEYAPRKIRLIEGMEETDRRVVLPYQIDSNNYITISHGTFKIICPGSNPDLLL